MKRFIRENRWFVSAVALVLVFGFLCFDLVTAKRLFKWDAWYLFWPMVLSSQRSPGQMGGASLGATGLLRFPLPR